MRMTSQVCSRCSRNYQIAIKEYTRRANKGQINFYCSLSCARKRRLALPSEPVLMIAPPLPDPESVLVVEPTTNKKRRKRHKGRWSHTLTQAEHNNRMSPEKKAQYELDDPHLDSIFKGRCALSKIPIFVNLRETVAEKREREKNNQEKKLQYNKASLDRIDSDIGYSKKNTQFLSTAINFAKHKFSQMDMKIMIYQTITGWLAAPEEWAALVIEAEAELAKREKKTEPESPAVCDVALTLSEQPEEVSTVVVAGEKFEDDISIGVSSTDADAEGERRMYH